MAYAKRFKVKIPDHVTDYKKKITQIQIEAHELQSKKFYYLNENYYDTRI